MRFGRFLAAVSAAALVAAPVGVAMASNVDTAVVDTTAPTGAVSLQAGQSASIQINLTVTGPQDQDATFDVDRDWSLSGGAFTGSNPQTFTVAGGRSGNTAPATFSTTGTISVSAGQAVGDFTLAIGAINIQTTQTKSKLQLGTLSSYVVHVVPPADTTAPVITPNVSGTLGTGGWYTSDVTVSWSVTDGESTVSSRTGCDTSTVGTDTTGVTFTCSATSAGGTASKSVTVKRDATAPTITATPSTAANDAGYNNTAVDVSYTCSDSTSGLAGPCPDTDHASTDGTYNFAHTIHDQAGNAASANTTVNIDATKPTITGSRTLANGAGWNNGDVTVTFTCTDSGTGASGIKSCVADGTTPASDHTVLTADGANQSASGTATDNADNTNTATVSGINIDRTPPQISLVSRTPANTHGWNNTDVTVTWACTDSGSGVVSPTVTQTLSGDGAGQSATGTCTDLAGNQASATVTGINIDKTAPVITFGDRAPGGNAAGWNNTDVTVTWQCSDAVSDVLLAAVSTAVATEGAGQSATGTCEDLAGNQASATVGGINIDKTAPTVAFTSAAPAANAVGWNNADVTATFTATDNLSGFAGGSLTATGTAATSGEGAGLTLGSPAFTDLAGNTAAAGAATSPGFNVDKTAPGIAFDHQDPAVNANGWNNTDVTLYWNCTDDLSGPATTPVTQVISAEGSNLGATGTCLDEAGNPSSDTVTGVYIDKQAPNAPTVSVDPAANSAGWNRSPVTVSFTANGDNGPSGVEGCTAPVTISVETPFTGVGVEGTCSDLAGNTSTTTTQTVRLDTTAPINVTFSGGPVDGGRYFPNNVPPAPTCTADDALSGLASCVVTGYSAAVGTHTLTATATDRAGNVRTATGATYTVRTLTLSGFFAPVDPTSLNTVKNGSTVPLKFRVFDGSVEQISTSVVKSFTTKSVSCSSGLSEDPVEELATTASTTLRYDATGQQFIQNWKTPATAGACYQVTMTTVDDSSIAALFKLK